MIWLIYLSKGLFCFLLLYYAAVMIFMASESYTPWYQRLMQLAACILILSWGYMVVKFPIPQ